MNATELRTYITAGKAIVTIKSLATGTHFTYRVTKVKDRDDRFFVGLLTGSDNEHDYSYLGLLHVHASSGHLSFSTTRKSCADEKAPSVTAIRWTLGMVNRGLSFEGKAQVEHEGRCGRCGRTLTHPESIQTGIGPECAKKVA